MGQGFTAVIVRQRAGVLECAGDTPPHPTGMAGHHVTAAAATATPHCRDGTMSLPLLPLPPHTTGLYQAIMSLFNELIRKEVQAGIEGVVSEDVPKALNRVLASLPTHVDITGLPFTTSFEYSIYTSTFVLVKGYGEVGAQSTEAATAQITEAATARSTEAATARSTEAATAQSTEAATAQSTEASTAHRGSGQGAVLPSTSAVIAGGGSGGSTGVSGADGDTAASLARTLLHATAAAAAATASTMTSMHLCPFDVSQLPLTQDMIGSDPRMFTLYVHENMINCVLWAMYTKGLLAANITNGSIPNLHLTTDLLAMLIPDLPKTYPRQYLMLDVQATSIPKLAFDGRSVRGGQGRAVALAVALSIGIAIRLVSRDVLW